MVLRAASLACCLFVISCSGELVPVDPSAAADGGGGGGDAGDDMVFRPRVQSELEAAGCAASACHGGTAAPMQITASPGSDDDWRANYNQVKARAGTASSSLLIDKTLGAGGHVAAASEGDPLIAHLRTWVSTGAPYEQVAGGADGGVPGDGGSDVATDAAAGAGLTWQRDVDPIMRARCVVCHGSQGSYSVESYSAALGFGRDGIPNVVPGDPTSLLAQYVEQGHEGIPAVEALVVVEWIVDWDAAER